MADTVTPHTLPVAAKSSSKHARPAAPVPGTAAYAELQERAEEGLGRAEA